MSDLSIVHELIYGDFEWPSELRTDIGRISYFARENNISLEELLQAIEKFISIYHKDKKTDEYAALFIYKESANKAIKARKNLVGKLNVLDTKLTGTGGYEYAAVISKERGKITVRIVQKRRDDNMGEMTGIPNAEYWDGTPGSYYASTLLGSFGGYRGGNVLCIDGGTNWNIYGMNNLRKEIEEKYGDEIRKEFNYNESKKEITAKKVYENLN